MSIIEVSRPQPSEYHDFYDTYVSVVPEGDLCALLTSQAEDLQSRLRAAVERSDLRYAPGKWSTKEVVGHIIDTERIFTYRALTMARGDRQPLPGMDQDLFAEGARFAERTLDEILEEYRAVRAATLALFRSFDEEALSRTGTASGFSFSVRALCHIVVGHETHHLNVLRERYGV